AGDAVAAKRRNGFAALAEQLANRAPFSQRMSAELSGGLSDLQFTGAYRVPFQYGPFVRRHLKTPAIAAGTDGVVVRDADGNESYDVAGSYGVNVFGTDFYKSCLDEGIAMVRELGPVLGMYHPVAIENVARLRAISGLDEVSFHMSGTEAVMQAVRLA